MATIAESFVGDIVLVFVLMLLLLTVSVLGMMLVASTPSQPQVHKRTSSDYFKYVNIAERMPTLDSGVTFYSEDRRYRGVFTKFGQFIAGNTVFKHSAITKWKYTILW